MAISFSAGGHFCAIGTSDYLLCVYRLSADQEPKLILEVASAVGRFNLLQFSHFSVSFLSSCAHDSFVDVWSFARGKWSTVRLDMRPRASTRLADLCLEAFSFAWNCSDSLVVTAVSNGSLKIWNPKNGRLMHVLVRHEQPAYLLVAHPFDPRLLLSGGRDGLMVLWDLTTGANLWSHPTGVAHEADLTRAAVYAGAFSPDGTRITCADSRGHLHHFGLGHPCPLFAKLPDGVFFETDRHRLIFDDEHFGVDARVSVL